VIVFGTKQFGFRFAGHVGAVTRHFMLQNMLLKVTVVSFP
jgi:hypothetical protein